uniref:Putative secreted peptide n=1 Tax=Anopheles braziliensis TaxID=58242 RepID=A0A2M3ZWH1_9DIPT
MRGPRRFGPIFASQIWRLLTLVRYAATQYGKLGSPEHRFVELISDAPRKQARGTVHGWIARTRSNDA